MFAIFSRSGSIGEVRNCFHSSGQLFIIVAWILPALLLQFSCFYFSFPAPLLFIRQWCCVIFWPGEFHPRTQRLGAQPTHALFCFWVISSCDGIFDLFFEVMHVIFTVYKLTVTAWEICAGMKHRLIHCAMMLQDTPVPAQCHSPS